MRREGKRVRSDHLDVRALASPLSYPRVGIVVPRFQHTIVERNKLRRRLRELVRAHLLPRMTPQDVLVRAQPPAYSRSFEELEREVCDVARRLGAAGHE